MYCGKLPFLSTSVFFRFGQDVKIVHFIGAIKPWHYGFNINQGTVEGADTTTTVFLQHWWNIFMKDVKTHLSPELVSFGCLTFL